MVRKGLQAVVQEVCDWSNLIECKIDASLPIAGE